MRYFSFILIFIAFEVTSQTSQLSLASIPWDARTAALGGNTISIFDGDLPQSFNNPAALDSVAPGAFMVGYHPYFADIQSLSMAFHAPFRKIGALAIGIQYLSYGEFERREANGELSGIFNAQDYLLTIGKSHRVGPFVFGANTKLAVSTIDNQGASALLFDFGGVYQHPGRPLTIALTFQNVGFTTSRYIDGRAIDLPFDVQIGSTFKPQYMPFRFSFTLYNLTNDNLIFDRDESGDRINDQINRALRRLSLGAELLISDNFQLLVGYNHLRRQELSLENTGGGAGLSFGLLIAIKKFKFRYTHARYHAAGGANFLTLQTNLLPKKNS